MNVFTEWHHGGLFHAQQLLWEKRLGYKLFAPVGFDWVLEGFWKLSENPATQRQYLDPLSCEMGDDGFLRYWDKGEQIWQRRITLSQFKEMQFDFVVGSLSEHCESFRRLQKQYQPNAKFIRLSGNTGEQVDWSLFDNFIDTTGLYNPPREINRVVIHQEFPLETFYYEEPKKHKSIKNFMNQLNEARALPVWNWLKKELPEFEFKMHGSGGDDGMIDGLAALGDSMRDMGFLFQVKHHGEGFGHVIHNTYSVGRPAIAAIEFYRGKIAEHFLIDNESAILLDNKDPGEVVEQIRFWSEPENHLKMCKKARELFVQYVDFDEDERKFRQFLANIR